MFPTKTTTKNHFLIKTNSVILAALFSVPAINAVLGVFISNIFGIGLMSFLYLFLTLGLCALMVLSILEKFANINIKIGIMFIAILLFYIATHLRPAALSVSIVDFVVYVFVPILCAQFLSINVSLFLKFASIFPAPGILFISNIFVVDPSLNYIEMGICYAFLPTIICNIAYLFCFFKKEKHIVKIFMFVISMCNLIFLSQLLFYGSRGPLLAIVLTVLFFFAVKHKENEQGIFLVKSKIIFMLIFAFVLLMNFWTLLEFFNNALNNADINIKFIEKMLRLHKQGDILNGRDLNYEAAWSGILEHPLFGNGLATYEYYTGYVYPHNLFLQLLYDGGLLLLLIVMVPAVIHIFTWAKKCSYASFCILFTLLFISIPSSLFSGDIWTKPILWYALALLEVCSSKNNENYLVFEE